MAVLWRLWNSLDNWQLCQNNRNEFIARALRDGIESLRRHAAA